MKANNRYDCVSDPQKAHLTFDVKTQAAYAHYFARYIKAYGTRGVRVQALHMQNEAAQCQIFPSALWTGAQMRDFLRDYLAPTLRSEGLKTELWLGTVNYADYDAYAGVVLADPRLAPQITGIGYQWDGKAAIAEAHRRHPNLRLMQTESECGDGSNDAKAGFYTFSLMRHYFNAGANSYVYWNMVLDPKGPSTWGWEQNSLITVSRASRTPIYNFEYHVMRHVSGLVRPGAKLLNIDEAENALAFLNPDGAIVLVYANPADQPQELTLQQEGHALNVTVPPRSMSSWVIDATAKSAS
jgi:glucosylceramidase